MLFGHQLPFASEEATLILLVPRFGYITPKNGDFQYALPRTGERTQVNSYITDLYFN